MKNALVLLLTAALLAGCNKEDDKAVAPAGNDPALVAPAPELLARLQLADIGIRPVAETLRVAGSIEFDEQRLARIGATVTGRVMQIDALVGQAVHKGEVLARLNSSELSSQQLAYLKARAQLELNRRNAERAKSLFNADVIAAAEMQRRESEYQISVAEARTPNCPGSTNIPCVQGGQYARSTWSTATRTPSAPAAAASIRRSRCSTMRAADPSATTTMHADCNPP